MAQAVKSVTAMIVLNLYIFFYFTIQCTINFSLIFN